MNQREAVIEAMKANGGAATLAHLYKEALKVPNVEWKTLTPFKSINRIVQDSKYFYKIKPGLWGLNEEKHSIEKDESLKLKPESDHTFYQGLIAELGKMNNFETFIPRQDAQKSFMGKTLDDLATLKVVHPFTYEDVVRRASAVDVIWFKQRFPAEFIEVENTTDMNGALLKFSIFEPFYAIFRIVAPSAREKEFNHRVSQPVFEKIKKRVKFTTYEQVSELHTKTAQLRAIENVW